MSKHIITAVILLIFPSIYNAQVKYGNEFLNIGVGARGMAMSGSITASSNDVYSGYYNPAGLAQIENNIQAAFMHSEYFVGLAKYDFLSVAAKIDEVSTGGFSVIRFGIDDIPNTLDLISPEGVIDYNKITKFSAVDYAFLFSFARRIPVIDGLDIGGNLKVIHRSVGEFANAWGFGIDVGATYTTPRLKLGITAKDITSTFNAWSFQNRDKLQETFSRTNNVIPQNSLEFVLPQLAIGGGYLLKLSEKYSIYPELGLNVTFDGKRNVLLKSSFASVAPKAGLEFSYDDLIYLRGGIGNWQEYQTLNGESDWAMEPNIGVGVHYKIFTLDYALTNLSKEISTLYSHVFSIKVEIDKK